MHSKIDDRISITTIRVDNFINAWTDSPVYNFKAITFRRDNSCNIQYVRKKMVINRHKKVILMIKLTAVLARTTTSQSCIFWNNTSDATRWHWYCMPCKTNGRIQCAPDISWYILSRSNSRKTPIDRPWVLIRSKFYLQLCCVVCSIVLYCTAVYRESLVYCRISSTERYRELQCAIRWQAMLQCSCDGCHWTF